MSQHASVRWGYNEEARVRYPGGILHPPSKHDMTPEEHAVELEDSDF